MIVEFIKMAQPKKTVSVLAFKHWEKELLKNYTYTEVDGKIVRMVCKVCSNVENYWAKYRGKDADLEQVFMQSL